nr:hypothetical protein [uncultured Pedobacter sp.]
MFTGVGEAKAVVNGAEAANVLSKTAEAARVAEETNAAAKALEAANAAKEAKAARTLGEVVSSKAKTPKLMAGTVEHKADRWLRCQKRNGKWSYETADDSF